MKLIRQKLATFSFLLLLCAQLFAQTTEISFEKGEALLKKDPRRAYLNFEKAAELAKQDKRWDQYLRVINRLAFLVDEFTDEENEKTFKELKDADDLLINYAPDSSLAQFHFFIASFYDNYSYEINLPIHHFQKSIKIWTDLSGAWNEHVAACYHGLGDIYKYKKSDFDEAERCYEKALKIREKNNFSNTRTLTRNYYDLALTNRSQADYEKALAYGIKALTMTPKLNSAIYSEMCNAMVANIYRDMDESALARKYYLSAIEINKKTNDEENLAWYYSGLGELSKNDSLYDDALTYLKKAYDIYTRIDADKLLLAALLQLMNEVYALNNDTDSFYRTFHELFQQLRAMNLVANRLAPSAYVVAGDFQFRNFRYDSALIYYQSALKSALPAFDVSDPAVNPGEHQVGVNYYVYEILAKKASVLKSLSEKTNSKLYLDQSLQCLFLAEKLLSLQRNTLDLEDSKWRFLESNYNIYEAILSTLFDGLKFHNDDDSLLNHAFRYFEQSKVRSLADALAEAERTSVISSKDTLIQRHADLKRKLLGVQDKLNQELLSSSTATSVVELRGQIVSYDRDIQKHESLIEEKYPGYFNALYGYRTPELGKIQEIIAQEDRVLIEYFWGIQSVYALCILPNEVLFKRIGAPDSIRHIFKVLLESYGERHSSLDIESFRNYTSSAHKLYELLLEPFQTQLKRKKRLQIIPDGMISQIPFEVLLETKANTGSVNYRSLDYLLRSFTIGYTYSSSMLVQAAENKSSSPTLLAFGFTGGQRLRAPSPSLTEIGGTEKELEALARQFSHGKFLVGMDATESNFKILAPNFDILHLAVHGKGDSQRKFTASLYFRNSLDSLEDGELHAYELYGLKLKARMAVLTSCEAGIGKDFKGEGMLSMASAFTYSGCENILMSLWKVNDRASITIMNDFYEYLLDGMTIDEALRQAKLNYLEKADEITADPIAWAPMVAYGRLDEVFPNNRSKMIWVIAVTSLLFVIIMLLYIKKRRRV